MGEPRTGTIRWPLALIPEKLGEGLIGPILPIYAGTLVHATPARIGLMEASFQALAVLGAFAWGRTSDQVAKRKAFIVLGFVGSGVCLAGMALADSFWTLFAWRGLFGFLAAGHAAIGGALVADRARPETIGDHMGLLRSVGGAGYVAGLVAGGFWVSSLSTGALFAVAAALSGLSGVAAWAWIDEPTSHLSRGEVASFLQNVATPVSMGIQRRLYNPTVYLHRPRLDEIEERAWLYLAATGLSFVGTTAGFVLFPLYLTGLGVSSATVFGLFVVNAALSAVLYRPMGRLADRFGYRRVQVAAVGTRSVMYLVLLVPTAYAVPAAGVFLAMAGISWAVLSVTGPAALLRTMPVRERGELMGLYAVAAGLGSMVGAVASGFLARAVGFRGLFAIAAAIVAVAAFALSQAMQGSPGEPPAAQPA